jgi:hypothetical protein
MRHELGHYYNHVSKGLPSETFLSGKSSDTVITMLIGKDAANRQKP